MTIKKIYSLPLIMLLFSACSTKQMPIKQTRHSIDINRTTTAPKIVAIQSKKIVAKAPVHTLYKDYKKQAKQIFKPITKTEIATIAPQPIMIQEEPIESIKPINIENNIISSQDNIYTPEPIVVEDEQEYQTLNEQRYTNTSSNLLSSNSSNEIQGDFQGNYNLSNFIDRMVNEQGFDRNYLNEVFSQAQNTNYFVKPYTSSSSSYISGAWDRYKQNFIYERNIQRGIKFWNDNRATLDRATAEYGVPAEYIVGIIGIETAYGVNFGKKKVLDVLTTKSMLPNRRSSFYTKQLEKFLIMTRKSNLNPTELMGSNAGAMGYGQFIASSYLDFAVDFNGDGTIDLWNADDAIGSIANYFARNGWNRYINQVAIRAKYRGNRFKRLKTGYKTKYSQYKLRRKYKIKPRKKMSYSGPVSLVRLNRATHDELWFGTHNFRVLTTYNHSTHYGMAVFQLAKEVKNRRGGYYSSL